MNRLVWLAVTAVAGYYVKKRTQEKKQAALSQSSYRAAERQWYDNFKFMEEEGYVLEEERTGVSYRLLCKSADLVKNPKPNFLFLLRHPGQPEGYVLLEDELVSLHTFEPLFEQTLSNSETPLAAYAKIFRSQREVLEAVIR